MVERDEVLLKEIGTLLQRGVWYTRNGRFEEAESCIRTALDAAVGNLDESHRILIDSRACLANVYAATARFDEAAALLDEALAAAKRHGAEPALIALLLNNRGGISREASHPAEALCWFRQAAELEVEAMGRARAEENAALCLGSLGQFDEARALFERSLATWQACLPGDHAVVSRSKNNLALLNHQAGDFGSARSGFNDALLRLAETDENTRLRATIFNNRAMLAHETGDYEAAAIDFQDAVALFRSLLGDEHPDTVTAVSNWGMLLLDAGQFEAAEPLLRQCAEIRQRTGPIVKHATSFNILGLLCLRTKRLTEAESLLQHAIHVSDSVDDELAAISANVARNNLALTYSQRGAFHEARQLFETVVQQRRERFGNDHPNTEQALFNLATTLAKLGDHSAARQFLDEAARIDEQALRQVFRTAADSERSAFLWQLRTRWNAYLSVVRNDGGADAIKAGLEFALRRRALGLEALLAQSVAGRTEEDTTTAQCFRELVQLQKAIRLLAAGAASPSDEKRRVELLRRQVGVERELASITPTFGNESGKGISLEEVQAELPSDGALIEIVRIDQCLVVSEADFSDGRYLAFVLRGDGERPVLVDLGTTATIDDQIGAYLHVMGLEIPFDRGFEAYEQEAAEPLLASIRPLRDALKGCSKLFVVPDGEFSRLPFPVLPIDSGSRLIDVFEVSFLTSGRDLLRRHEAEPQPDTGPALVLGDPEFDVVAVEPCQRNGDAALRSRLRDAEDHFAPLPNTRAEAEAVGSRLGVQPLLGLQASGKAVVGARSPNILHVATHGFFLDTAGATAMDQFGETGSNLSALATADNPLLHSGLVLAGANVWLRNEDPGPEFQPAVLTAADLATCDLRGTQLVTLSACDTGRGRIRAGEGVFGLQRGLVMAGAAAVTMSMWPVPDRETMQLMLMFYENLEEDGVSGALRRAQLSMKERTSDPRDWGAFVVLTARLSSRRPRLR